MERLDPKAIIAAIRSEVETGVDQVLNATEACLREMTGVRGGSAEAIDRLEQGLCLIMEACAFQDLTGQRLSVLGGLIDPAPRAATSDPLLNGPALTGGLDQTAADRLLTSGIPVD